MTQGDIAVQLGVDLTDEVPPPVADPSFGIDVAVRPGLVAPAHPLVTIGDSLTEGFQHLAIVDGAWSWPSIAARRLGIELVRPHYDDAWGGQPYNLERLTRRFDERATHNLAEAYAQARGVDDHYGRVEVGAPGPDGPINENLAVWGWDLRDTLERTAATERLAIGPLAQGPIPALPTSAWAAVRVLDTARRDGVALTPLGAARRLGEDPGGIGTLCVWLGANNILGTVIDLDVRPSGPGFDTLAGKARMNAWTVEHFTIELQRVAAEVAEVNAAHVLWGTVPHVTIPPVTRGLGGPLPECPRYFRWYGRPWQQDDTFNPDVDRCLTGRQAWVIDSVIDAYNRAIRQVVQDGRARGRDWQLVDLCPLLDRLALRRNVENAAAPAWAAGLPDARPEPLRDLTTAFFGSDRRGRRTQGGLFGLDGVHPTTCGYGIVAQAFVDAVRRVDGKPPTMIDFRELRTHDSLVSRPPRDLDGVRAWLRGFDHAIDPVQWVLRPTHVLPV